MEHSLDNSKISKEFSSYSSFYKTQVSLSRGEREETENGRTGLENNKADETDEKHETINKSSINTLENANNNTMDQRQSDMNNNSSRDEKINNASSFEKRDKALELENKMLSVNGKGSPVHDADVEVEDSNEASTNLIQTSKKEISKVEAPEGTVIELQVKDLNVKVNDEITGEATLVDKLSRVQKDQTPPMIASPLQNSDLNISPEENKGSGSKTQLEDKGKSNNTSSALFVEQVLKTADKTAQQNGSPEPRSEKSLQSGNEVTSKIKSPEPFSKLQASPEDKASLSLNSPSLIQSDQKLQRGDKTTLNITSPKQEIEPEVQSDDKIIKVNCFGSGYDQPFQSENDTTPKACESLEERTITDHDSIKQSTDQKLHPEEKASHNIKHPDPSSEQLTPDEDTTKHYFDTSIHSHEWRPSSRLENDPNGDDREDINHSSLKNEGTEQRLHSNSPSDHAIKAPFQDIGNNPVIDIPCANDESKNSKTLEERPLKIEKGNFAMRQHETNNEDQLPETEHLKVSEDEIDIDNEIFQKTNLTQEESNRLHLNNTKNDRENNGISKTFIDNETITNIHLVNEDKKDLKGENEDKKGLKGEIDKQPISKDNCLILTQQTHKENFETKEEINETLERQPPIVTDDDAGPVIRPNTTYDNLYFTGRLPSLLSKNDSSHSLSVSADRSCETAQAIAEDEEVSHLKERANARVKESGYLQSTISNDNDAEMKNVSNARKLLTPSSNINDIIREMKKPEAEIYQLSRETPLTPRSTLNRSKSANASYRSIKTNALDPITTVQTVNEPVIDKEEKGKGESVNMTVKDISMVTSKVLGSTHAEDSRSRFDDLPHMKHITQYVQENLNRKETPNKDKETNEMSANLSSVHNDKEDFDITQSSKVKDDKDKTIANQPIRGHKSSQQHSKIKFFESKDEFDSRMKNSDPSKSQSVQETSQKPEEKQVQRSSSENDLKAIIASAKMAISNGTETSDSQLGFETTNTLELTLQGDNMSIKRRKILSRSFASQKGVWSTPNSVEQKDAPAALICSNCLQVDSNVHKAGYCIDCQQYLCGTCITIHTVDSETRLHDIVPSYCKNELAINKYMPATGYCVDCSMFLCMKCTVQHTGFRVNRHHRIIQSSFVSKPTDIKGGSNEFLDRVQNKLDLNDSRASSKGNKEQKRKRKLLVDLDNSNPYNVPYTHVPESLYKGRKTKLAPSYTKNPKWAHSSIPNLPYLVQPKPIPDRVFHAAGHTRPRMIYTRPKAGVDAMALKLKTLKSTYKIKDEIKTHRRREQATFTARPAKARDDFSLPDIQSVKSHTSGRKSIKHTVDHDTSSVKKETEFINDYCLSIPFPRGEKRADIVAMTVLLNGKLVTLDRSNNNIKLYNKVFHCISGLQFQNRLVDICASNICQTDVYAATTKHIYEISVEKGMEIARKIKVEIKRIEGIVCWKYGLAIIAKKTNITWELRLLDYRGNLKSKLEIFNPFTLDIGSRPLQHMTSSRGGKFISLSDTKNSCIITVDVTTRVVLHETLLEEGKCPTYITSDGEGSHNLYVACDNKVFQISKKGKIIGVLIDKAKENGEVGCIVYNKLNNRLYVKTGKDIISVYQIYF